MKHKLSLILAIVVLGLFASSASAQEVRMDVRGNAEVLPVRVETRNEMEARVETRAETRTETRAENRAEARNSTSTERRMEVQASIAKRLALNTSRVLAATIERLERIIIRLESRIEKFEANGAVVTDAKTHTVEAQAHLDLAKDELRAFASIEIAGERAQDNFSQVRVVAAEVKMHIREAHTSLRNAVASLKASASAEVDVR